MQVMNDEGVYMFSSYAGKWIPDTPGRRQAVLERLATWNAFSNSSPVEGIEAAIQQHAKGNQKISIYVLGDEFTGRLHRRRPEDGRPHELPATPPARDASASTPSASRPCSPRPGRRSPRRPPPSASRCSCARSASATAAPSSGLNSLEP